MTKCTWVNQQHLRLLDDAALVAYARPWLEKAGITPGNDEAYIARTLNSVKEKVSLASEFPSWVHFFFTEDFAFEDEVMSKLKANAQASKLLAALQSGLQATSEWTEAGLGETVTKVAATEGVKAGALMPLLRFSLSGQTRGPDVKVMMVALGQERSIARLGRAAALLA